jgi:hypothetical protein
MTNKTLAQIERRIDKIKALLSGIGEMRPGSLTQQFKDRESQTGPCYQLKPHAGHEESNGLRLK